MGGAQGWFFALAAQTFHKLNIVIIFGSDRSPRRQDVVRACVLPGLYAQKHAERAPER